MILEKHCENCHCKITEIDKLSAQELLELIIANSRVEHAIFNDEHLNEMFAALEKKLT